MFGTFQSVVLQSFIREKKGATMIEYGLIAALVSVVAIAALGSTGNNLRDSYTLVSDCLMQAQTGSTC